jgi:hypothetical protein
MIKTATYKAIDRPIDYSQKNKNGYGGQIPGNQLPVLSCNTVTQTRRLASEGATVRCLTQYLSLPVGLKVVSRGSQYVIAT